MLTASQIKYVKSLQQKKFRDLNGVFVAEGEKIVAELEKSSIEIEAIFATSGWIEATESSFAGLAKLYKASAKDMERISTLKAPSKVVAIIKKPHHTALPKIDGKQTLLVLDTIQDPGNLGTIIRTADWFGIKQIVCSTETADVFNPKVIQATMGSFTRVKVFYTNLNYFLREASKKACIIGATLRGTDINKCKPEKGCILVIGNESKGISKEILPFLTQEIIIPGGESDEAAESLNASIAAGILMAWISKSFDRS